MLQMSPVKIGNPIVCFILNWHFISWGEGGGEVRKNIFKKSLSNFHPYTYCVGAYDCHGNLNLTQITIFLNLILIDHLYLLYMTQKLKKKMWNTFNYIRNWEKLCDLQNYKVIESLSTIQFFVISISLQPNNVSLRYFKLRIFDLTAFIVLNIKLYDIVLQRYRN